MMENEPCQAPAGLRLFYEKPAIILRQQSHLLPEEEDYTCVPFPPRAVILSRRRRMTVGGGKDNV